MKINLFFGSYSIIGNDLVVVSKSQANAGKFTTITIDSANSWTMPSSIATSNYGYLIYQLYATTEETYSGGAATSTFSGYRSDLQTVYIPPQSTRIIKYVNSEILSINGKNFYCHGANTTWSGQFILVPATRDMLSSVALCTDKLVAGEIPTSGTLFAYEYMIKTTNTNKRCIVIDNDAYTNSLEHRLDSKPGYTLSGFTIYEYYSPTSTSTFIGSASSVSPSSTLVYLVYLMGDRSDIFVYPTYRKTYIAPLLDTSTLTVNSDGSVSWSYSFLLDNDSVKDNQPTSCKMRLSTDGVSSTYFTPSGYTTDYPSSSKVRVTYSGIAESGTIYDSSKKVMTFDQSMDTTCTIMFKDATDFTESTATVSIRYIGTHPAFAVSNRCQSIGIFKRPDKDSSGYTKAGLTIGDSMYIHTSNHQAITVTGENSDVGTMIDLYNSDVSDNTVSIGIGIGSGHVNRGIYDNTLGGWSVCTQSDKTLHLGTANTGGVISDRYFTANGGLTVKGRATITDRADITGQTTVTNGNVYMPTSGSNTIVINKTDQNYNTYDTGSSIYHWLVAKQSNGKTVAYIEHERTSAGNDNINVIARHHSNDSTSAINKISIGRSASANTYSVSDPSAFRAAIGANNAANINTGNLSYERIRSALETPQKYNYSSSTIVLKVWHSGSGYMTLYWYGSIGIITAYQVEVSKTNTWETITQLGSGARPKYNVRVPLAAAGTPSYNGGVMELNTSGYVRLYNPESATGNVMMSGSLSFIAAQ